MRNESELNNQIIRHAMENEYVKYKHDDDRSEWAAILNDTSVLSI